MGYFSKIFSEFVSLSSLIFILCAVFIIEAIIFLCNVGNPKTEDAVKNEETYATICSWVFFGITLLIAIGAIVVFIRKKYDWWNDNTLVQKSVAFLFVVVGILINILFGSNVITNKLAYKYVIYAMGIISVVVFLMLSGALNAGWITEKFKEIATCNNKLDKCNDKLNATNELLKTGGYTNIKASNASNASTVNNNYQGDRTQIFIEK